MKIKTIGSMVNGLDEADKEENKKANVKAQTIVLESGSSIGAADRNVTTNLVINPLMEAEQYADCESRRVICISMILVKRYLTGG